MKAWNRIMVLASVSLLTFSGLNSASYVSALSYQKDVDVKFTFNPFLAISLSSADLIIPNLNPGTSAYSNTISIDVDTNNVVGYTLSAKVGDGTNYTNDKLVNTNTNVTFDNITASSVLAGFGDNKWGYTLGTVNTDSLYSGLIYNEDTIINATTNASGTASEGYTGTNTTNFTIGAKASDTMASGDYKNVIVFNVVSNVTPTTLSDITYMQDSFDCDATAIGATNTLIDTRDGKSYTVAKLADGKCWMTANLDLAGGTALTYENTDFAQSYTIPTTNGWQSGGRLPESSFGNSDVFANDGYAYVYNSGASADSCIDEDIGGVCYSYYSWDAATVGSGRGISSSSPNAIYSICPKGWRLPQAFGSSSSDYINGDYYALATAYGVVFENGSSASTSIFYDNAGPNTAPNFLPAGIIASTYIIGPSTNGFYWTSSGDYSTPKAYLLGFTNSVANVSYSDSTRLGASVRCVAR